MNVQPFNSSYNATSFGAGIKLAVPKADRARLIETADRTMANDLLNRFQVYHPGEKVEIGTKIDKARGPVMYAKNLITGYVFYEKCPVDTEGRIGNNTTFYKLISDVLNQNLLAHNDFWRKNVHGFIEPKPSPLNSLGDVSPAEHSVFIG